jgi:hypothetical protein
MFGGYASIVPLSTPARAWPMHKDLTHIETGTAKAPPVR